MSTRSGRRSGIPAHRLRAGWLPDLPTSSFSEERRTCANPLSPDLVAKLMRLAMEISLGTKLAAFTSRRWLKEAQSCCLAAMDAASRSSRSHA